MKIRINRPHKSIPLGISFELPSFSVITGKNGSGKSHLLEAIADGNTAKLSDTGEPLRKAILIGFGSFSPHIDDLCEPVQLINSNNLLWSRAKDLLGAIKQRRLNGQQISDPIKDLLADFPGETDLLIAIKKISEQLRKKPEEITEQDFFIFSNITGGNSGTLFAPRLALTFKAYHTRFVKNKFRRFMNFEDKTDHPVLSDDEFFKAFGPKPWEVVDEILKRAGLTYTVTTPDGTDIDSTYALRPINNETRAEISANELSTGEKVLMSLALAIYNAQDSSGKPDVLILDEPDAPLHPEYSKLLVEVLREVVVERAGVPVIMTTHSPSTVAMCPNNSLFEINKVSKIPEMISISRGVKVLTDGIPHLRISNEARRQIFVESKHDVKYFDRLYNAIQRSCPLDYDPIFLEPHTGASNCSDVQAIVKRLHDAGSDLVRGVIDWDGKNASEHPIYVLGGGKRYSIENYIIDPLFVGLALVRLEKRKLSDFSIKNLETYTEASKIGNSYPFRTKISRSC